MIVEQLESRSFHWLVHTACLRALGESMTVKSMFTIWVSVFFCLLLFPKNRSRMQCHIEQKTLLMIRKSDCTQMSWKHSLQGVLLSMNSTCCSLWGVVHSWVQKWVLESYGPSLLIFEAQPITVMLRLYYVTTLRAREHRALGCTAQSLQSTRSRR